ncbi:MAG: fused MFS/spermidine synthase [Candidatus Omnitrophica bacterium]|nr:fused MFS/spermidine synthase [Candidatus Omnitrophota bacterium]
MGNKKINLVLYICFLFSGIAGLVYEVLWARYLALIFGNTAYAHTLVLATFMGGLALGSLLLGAWADKVKDKLTFYAWIEIGIALFCFFTPQLFSFSKNIYLTAARDLSLNPLGIIVIKFIIGAIIMLPPTFLMGGTLPVLSKFMVRSFAERGKVIARLYYINSFGAFCGALLAGFYLIYHFGLEASITIAALVNLFVGVTVVFLRAYCEKVQPGMFARKESLLREEKNHFYEEEIFSNKVINIALTGIFLSGLAAMLYELVWIRLLSTILGSSTYSFSLMLAAFISGITIGSFLISKFMPRPKHTFIVFGLCQVCIGASLILSLPFYEKLPYLFILVAKVFVRRADTFALYSTAKFLLAFLVMIVPTIFFGMTLPLVSKIASRKLELLGSKVGSVFAANTAGNILGALITGLVLIPTVGLKHTLELGIIVNLSLGNIVLFSDKTFLLKRKVVFASACCVLFLGYKLAIPEWNKACFNKQLFRRSMDRESISSALADNAEEKEVLFYKDGLEASVAVIKSGEILSLYINGKADASTEDDMPTQILCAQLPLLLKPQTRDILTVGLGSGITCGSALLHPIKSLDVVEISSSVVQANKHFKEFNYDALNDKRLNLYLEDAKTFLQRGDKKYDLIISEPSNPWLSGVGFLFSKEFFEDCRSRLNDRGLMIQWVQAYETNDQIYEMILRTFSCVFPEVTVWNTSHLDTILIGSEEKMTLDIDESEKRIAQAPVQQDLSRIELADIYTLLSLQISSNENINKTVERKGLIHSDFFPILDYMAPLALYTSQRAEKYIIRIDERKFPLEKGDLFIKDYLKERKIGNQALNNFFKYADKKLIYNKNFVFSLIKRWHRDFPGNKEAILAYSSYNIDFLEKAISALEELISRDSSFEYLDQYASLQLQKYWIFKSYLLPEIYPQTIEKLKRCLSLSADKKAKFYYHLGKVCYGNQDYKEAIEYYSQARRQIESGEEDADSQGLNYIGLLNEISIAYLRQGDLNKSFEYAAKVTHLDKDNTLARSLIEVIQTRLEF